MSSKPVLSKYLPSMLVLLIFLASYDAIASSLLPSSNITAPTDGTYLPASLGTYSITGAATDRSGTGLKKVEVSIDRGSTWKAAYDASGSGSLTSWKYTWSPLPLGSYSIISKATDNQNGTESPAPGVHVVIDGSPPVSTITGPLGGLMKPPALGTYSINGTSTDGTGSGVSKVEVSTDGGANWSTAAGTATWSYSWAVSADGIYSLKSRATDNATNVETPASGVTVEIDGTPPAGSVSINSGSLYTTNRNVTLTLSATDTGPTRTCPGTYPIMCNVAEMQFSINGTAWNDWEPATTTKAWQFASGDGEKTIYARYKDQAGNISIPYSATITLDTVPPASSITTPAAGAYITSPSVTITGNADDPAGSGLTKVEVSTDGGTSWHDAQGTGQWSYTWTTPTDGNYTIKTRATDIASNTETPGAGITVTVDKTPPASTITAPAAGASIGGAATYAITGTANDTGAGVERVEVSTDGGMNWYDASGTADWSYSWTLPTDGSYTIMTRAYDRAGNVETPGAGVSVNVDITPPAGSIAPRNGKYTKSKKVWFTLSARDAGSNCPGPDPVMCNVPQMQFSTDGVGWLAWQASATTIQWDFGTITDGIKVLYVRYKDPAGNISSIYNTSVTIDSTPPSSSITSPAGGTFAGGGATYSITGTASDAVSGVQLVEVSTNGGSTWATATDTSGGLWGTWSYVWTLPAESTYILMTRATDKAANVETPSAGISVTVDTTPPASCTVKMNSDAAYTNSTAATLALSASDSSSGVSQMRISNDGVFDTEPWEVFAASKEWTLPGGDGTKTVYAVYKDAAGNISTACSDAIVLDATPPDGSLVINTGAAQTNSLSVTLSITASDTGSGVAFTQVSNDGIFDTEPWEAYSASKAWTLATGDGTKTVYVRFKDSAENISGAFSDDILLNTDTASPAVLIDAPADGLVLTASSYTITGTADDGTGSGVKTVEVSTDGGATWSLATGATSWSYGWNITAAGPYSILIRATDNAGNTAITTPRTVTAKASISADRASVNLNYNLARPPAMTKVNISSQPLSLVGNASSTKSWMSVSTTNSGTPSGMIITVNPAGLVARNYTGTVVFSSQYATNGPISIPVSLTATPATTLSHELQHYNWNPVLTGGNCAVCHITRNKFLPADFRELPSFCRSCHNASSVAHDRGYNSSVHSVFVCASSGGGKWPTYGTMTAAQKNNQPFANLKNGSLVTCITCHNPMGKQEDYGRKWELASSSDRYTYYMNNGGWANYGYLPPMVYRTTGVMTEPSYSKSKKAYLVSSSEYTYDETAGSITFKTQQAAACIYVTLDYQYLRASSQDNRICTDCHTQSTHKGNNCQTCHTAHNTGNTKGIRESLRTPNRTSITVKFLRYTGTVSFADGDGTHDGICEVCHTQTKYYRRDGSGFANHSGGVNQNGRNCTICHAHNTGFGK